ncbi:DUF1349 domain-containing protein, partial [Klebsiella pneumoniae]
GVLGPRYPRAGCGAPLRRRVCLPPGAVKGGVVCSSRGGGGRVFVFQYIHLPPPLDKALHDLS